MTICNNVSLVKLEGQRYKKLDGNKKIWKLMDSKGVREYHTMQVSRRERQRNLDDKIVVVGGRRTRS